MYMMKLINNIFTWKNIIIQTILAQLVPIVLVLIAHTSPLEFSFITRNTNACELIMSTFPFFTLNFFTLVEKIERCTDNPKAKVLKIIRELFQRLIVSFVLVYALTVLSNNILLAILGMSNTIVFTIYGVWCVVVFTYLMALCYLFFAEEYVLIKARDDLVEKTLIMKVLSGFLGNSWLMSSLIRKVGDEIRPELGLMMRGAMLVVYMPVVVMIMVHVFLMVKRSSI